MEKASDSLHPEIQPKDPEDPTMSETANTDDTNNIDEEQEAAALGADRERLLRQIMFDDSDQGREESKREETSDEMEKLDRALEMLGQNDTDLEIKITRKANAGKDLEERTQHISNARQVAVRRTAPGLDSNVAVGVAKGAAGVENEDEAGTFCGDVETGSEGGRAGTPSRASAADWSGIPGAIAVSANGLVEDSSSIRLSDHEDTQTAQEPTSTAADADEERPDTFEESLTTVITAMTVDDDVAEIEERVRRELEQKIRNSFLKNVVEASAVEVTRKNDIKCLHILGKIAPLLLLVGGVLAAIFGSVAARKNKGAPTVSTSNPDGVNLSTLDRVRERGHVKCGLYESHAGFSNYNEDTKRLEGLNVDQCRAISIAVFGTPDKIEPVFVSPANRFLLLANQSMDVLTQTVTHTMGRDVFEPSAKTGFTFSRPYFYSGLAFAGIPEMVACAESYASGQQPDDNHCKELKVCVPIGTTHVTTLNNLMPDAVERILVMSIAEAVQKYVFGQCSVFASEPISMSKQTLRDADYAGVYEMGEKLFSREPLALVTHENDPEWSALVNTVVDLFFFAESIGANSQESDVLLKVNDSDLMTMAADIVSELGNYGELYERHLEIMVPRGADNAVYKPSQDTGLLYTMPYGKLENVGLGPMEGGALESILARGHLRCGVRSRPGFAEHVNGVWKGLDVEMCRAIAAGLFGTADDDQVAFEDLLRTSSDFYSLVNGDVDVVAGARVSLHAGYKETITGHAYSFSPSYFYDDSGGSLAMATSGGDPQWSDVVYWLVVTSFYAEENGISGDTFETVPPIRLFGEGLEDMLQGAVRAVGSYEEMYKRNLEDILPRSGRNQLNSGAFKGSQQFPLIP